MQSLVDDSLLLVVVRDVFHAHPRHGRTGSRAAPDLSGRLSDRMGDRRAEPEATETRLSQHACVVAQLRQLYLDLTRIFHRDPEQELAGVALTAVDSLFATARTMLESAEHPPPPVAVELISPAALETGAPVRAVDALVVTGQILAALGPACRRSPAHATS